MFTGIIEDLGKIESLIRYKDRTEFVIQTKFAKDLKTGDSVSVNGACLTVSEKLRSAFKAEAIPETIRVTSLDHLRVGDLVNLERALPVSGRFDGHIVLGHVDAKAMILNSVNQGSSREIEISIPENCSKYIAPKGSITIDGVSLTIASVTETSFKTAIVPLTAVRTNLCLKKIGEYVNLEFDVIAKYLDNLIKGKSVLEWNGIKDIQIDEDFLKGAGFLN